MQTLHFFKQTVTAALSAMRWKLMVVTFMLISAAATIPTYAQLNAGVKFDLVDNSDGSYKLVFSAMTKDNVSYLNVIFSFDNTMIMPVQRNAHSNDITPVQDVNDNPGYLVAFTRLAESDYADPLSVVSEGWKINGTRTAFNYGVTSTNPSTIYVTSNGAYKPMFEFYFRLQGAYTVSDITASTFKFENGADANNFVAIYNPSGFSAGIRMNGAGSDMFWWGCNDQTTNTGSSGPDNIDEVINPYASVSTPDVTPPTPGGSGAITTSSVTQNTLTLGWTAATDDVSAPTALKYYVYQKVNTDFTLASGLPTDGTLLNAGGTVNIAIYNVSSLSPGTTYYFIVVVEDEAGNKAAYTAISETTTAASTAPGAPGGFAAAPGNAEVVLTWTTPGDGGSAITGYEVSYGATSGYVASWTAIPASGASTVTHTVTGLTNGTDYTFEVRAINAIGNGASSGVQTATPVTTPAAPGGFAATAGNAEVVLTWTMSGNGGSAITGYEVSYGATSGYVASWTAIPSSGASTVTHTVTGLTNGTDYTFEVRAINAIGNGASSGVQTATPATTPAAPSGFTATAGIAEVVLNWTTPSNGGSAITGYEVSYGATSGYVASWTAIPASGASTVTHTVTGLINGTNYTFEVRAINAVGNGASSGTQTATPVAAATAPAAPGTFAATPGNAEVALTWTTPGNGGSAITGYEVSYGATSGYVASWSAIPASGASTVTHTVTGLTNGTDYTFEVRAINAVGSGASSGTQTAAPATTPAAPGGFTATAGNAEVVLTWTTPGNGGSAITGYEVSYGATSGYVASWTAIPASGASTVTHTVTGLTNGTDYTFEVRAINAIGSGASSGVQTATPATTPAAPGGFTATAGNAEVVLTWTTSGNGGSAITGYEVSYGATSGYVASWTAIPASGASTVTHTVTGLTNGTDYTFEVRAINAIGNGASSGVQTATPVTTPAAPGGFTATAGIAEVVLTWTTPSNGGSAITGYEVSYGATSGYVASWSAIPASGASTVTHTVTGLTNGTGYTFEVRAINAIGNGASSGVQTATPVSFNIDVTSPAIASGGTYTFTGALTGYLPISPFTFTVSNTGTGAMTTLAASISGTNFILDATGFIPTLAASGTTTFTIKPNDGLPAGTYTETVTISDANIPNYTFTVSFTVSATPTYVVEVISPAIVSGGTHTFTGATVGYTPVTPTSFTIRNTGTGAMTTLSASVSGTNFTLNATGLNATLASGGTTTFTVKPNDGLAAGTYTETVTISDANISNYTFTVSFIVSATPVKTVTVGTQIGVLTAGTAGSVTYNVTTTNITNGVSYPVTLGGAPAGVTAASILITGGVGTLTLSTTAAVAANVYPLTITIDGTTSGIFNLGVSPPAIPMASSIAVSGAGGATTITTYGGTLQMSAVVTPAAASQTVTWSVVNGTGNASISTTGLLTAISNGTVTVRAAATDGSGVSGSRVITISGQSTTPVYTLTVISGSGGGSYPAGTVITVKAEKPVAGREFDKWMTYNGGTFANAAGETTQFTMPGCDVTIRATYKDLSTKQAWENATALIEKATFTFTQQEANTLNEVRHKLVGLINELIKSTGIIIKSDDIIIYLFEPAIAGNESNISGANGHFEFRVTPANHASAYSNGTITATPFDPTANAFIGSNACNISAWVLDGMLHVSGLTPGNLWRVYNLSGTLLYQTVATDEKAVMQLPERGVYIIVTNECRTKIVN